MFLHIISLFICGYRWCWSIDLMLRWMHIVPRILLHCHLVVMHHGGLIVLVIILIYLRMWVAHRFVSQWLLKGVGKIVVLYIASTSKYILRIMATPTHLRYKLISCIHYHIVLQFFFLFIFFLFIIYNIFAFFLNL